MYSNVFRNKMYDALYEAIYLECKLNGECEHVR